MDQFAWRHSVSLLYVLVLVVNPDLIREYQAKEGVISFVYLQKLVVSNKFLQLLLNQSEYNKSTLHRFTIRQNTVLKANTTITHLKASTVFCNKDSSFSSYKNISLFIHILIHCRILKSVSPFSPIYFVSVLAVSAAFSDKITVNICSIFLPETEVLWQLFVFWNLFQV